MGVREAYLEKAEAQLHVWQAWIEIFKSNPNIAQTRKRIDLQSLIRQLDASFQNACARLDGLRKSRMEDWEFAKEALERAMIDLKRVLDKSGACRVGGYVRLRANRLHQFEPFERKE